MKMTVLIGAIVLLAAPAFAATSPILSSIHHPPLQIGTANVLDSSGRIIGAVQRVEVTPAGKPTQVAVALLSDQDMLLVLNADTVRYDAGSNQIIANANGAQLAAMESPN